MDASSIKTLLEKVTQQIAARRHLPESTYRLQFHAGFTFADATKIMPYLAQLGVTHVYASPLLKAKPGSAHGYDITDHQSVNPELGTEEEFVTWITELQKHGLSLLLDIVPNHMGIGNDNQWWQEVLENGPASTFAGFFDINWYSSLRPELHEKVLLPILGEPFGQALEAQQLALHYSNGAFTLHYFDHHFPITPRTYSMILNHRREALQEILAQAPEQLAEYESILTALKNLPPRGETDPQKRAERLREKEVTKRRLSALTESAPGVHQFIQDNVAVFNGQAGAPRSFDLLEELLQAQAYRLCNWRVASDEINYRRFFDINEMVALNTEHPEVFQATHALVLRWLREGKVQGLRIDHPDGLFEPQQYFERLQQAYFMEIGREVFDSMPGSSRSWEEIAPALWEACQDGEVARRPLYLVAEKILSADESLPANWPVFGTSGYDFLNMLNGLFVASTHAGKFSECYANWIQNYQAFAEVIYHKKLLILQVALASELHMLAQQLDRLAQKHRNSRDFTLNSLRYALREIIACFPVYRSYITATGVSVQDRLYVESAVARAQRRNPGLSALLFEFIRRMLLLDYAESATEEDREEQRRFVGKFQQVTAPVTAKGIEDTAFYVYNRFMSLNEVGGDPGRFGIEPGTLHAYFKHRQAKWPRALSATSTHDTKRSEDVRARLNAFSEMPEEWQEQLARWSNMNAPHRQQLEDTLAPDANDEYLFYQNLLGAWPDASQNDDRHDEFVGRMQAYLLKAIHEAKRHTSWINPYPAYDEAVQGFVAQVLDKKNNSAFMSDIGSFAERLNHCGLFNSLSQTLLKLTAPGAADIYQGNELWNFSLVDPDNRRPVNFEKRRRLLHELREQARGDENMLALASELVQRKEDGRIKLYTTFKTLHCRREHPGLFAEGEYLPLAATGAKATHVFAFLRRLGKRAAVVAVPRLIFQLVPRATGLPLGKQLWKDTKLVSPELEFNRHWRNLFTGELLDVRRKNEFAAAELFARFPVALLIAADSNDRL